LIENPFESGHIKNYILLYISIVVIMILFFIASSLFNDVDVVEKKLFNTKSIVQENSIAEENTTQESIKSRFKLLESAY